MRVLLWRCCCEGAVVEMLLGAVVGCCCGDAVVKMLL